MQLLQGFFLSNSQAARGAQMCKATTDQSKEIWPTKCHKGWQQRKTKHFEKNVFSTWIVIF